MISLYSLNCSKEWDTIVHSFRRYDVYYLSGYVKPFRIHGDGEPFLLYYNSAALRAIYVYMRRLTALPGWYDSITPYGYGGVLFEGDTSEEEKTKFLKEYLSVMEENHIVDNFVRYHPLLKNADPMRSFSEVIDLGQTVVMDLSNPEVIWDNITSKNRNMIRKAEKNGVKIFHGKDPILFNKFRIIYNGTMERDQADPYYFFGEPFYSSLHQDLYDNYEMFYAVHEEKVIAMSIIIYANGQMHYHLSGSLADYRNLAPSNLLLYKAALWGYEKGFKTFHLGGGVGSGDDNLFKFKAAFNRNSDCRFSIGKQIFDEERYYKLVEIKKRQDSSFDASSSFFPLYRA